MSGKRRQSARGGESWQHLGGKKTKQEITSSSKKQQRMEMRKKAESTTSAALSCREADLIGPGVALQAVPAFYNRCFLPYLSYWSLLDL